MALFSRLSRRRRTFASVSTVSIFSTAIAALAISNPGYDALDTEVNDSGVWVTNRDEGGLLGRFNYQAAAVDAARETLTADFDVLQQDEAVVLRDLTAGTLVVVDPAAVTFATPADLPGGAVVGMGGGVVAVLDPTAGMLWIQPIGAVQSVSAESTEPSAEGLDGGVLAVGMDGTVHVATATDATLRSYPPGEQGKPAEPVVRRLADVAPDDVLQVTAVGDAAVVHDVTQGRLHLPGREVDVESGNAVVLQEPGPEAREVVYATDTALVSQPLRGGAPRAVDARGSAGPTPPVVAKGCAYGAWAGTGQVVRDCGDDEPLVQSLEMLVSGAELRFRTNRGFVVLNELISGTVWLADDAFQRLDEVWDDVLTSVTGETEEADPTNAPSRDPLQDRDLPNRPPVANDDDFGVRPGRTTILPVLYNDTDPDGDVLTAALEVAPSFGEVELIYGGTGMQVTVPADAEGSTSFTYEANDGREAGTDTATVNLRVRADDENGLPEPIPGRETVAVVEQGGSVEINVLADWRDPDGDPLVLADASATTADDEVRFRPDGLVTFQDGSKEQGRKAVRIAVSDGRGEEVEGTVWVDVRPTGAMPPNAVADHATTAPGRPVVIRPLENDTDANGDTLRIARVDLSRTDATAVPDYDAGTITFTAEKPGAYDFTYLVADDLSTAYGLIRVDVLDGTADQAPVAVLDRALLPASGSVFVDVLGNDFDPAGGVLVVQSVTVPADAGLRVAVVNHEILEISAVRTLATGASVRVLYQISNGISSDIGEVLVIPLPAPERVQSPTAVDDEVTVRVGDVVTIPVLANDTHPQDLPLSLVRELYDISDPALGLLFTSEDAVRFQAGQAPGTLYATYAVTDGSSEPDSAQITIHIKDASTNAAPKPQSLTARVLAGTRTRIAIPLDGIDPDGDSVTLLGLQDAPTLGRIADWGEGWMEYEADASRAGTDTFTYAVRDAGGLQASATVLVGVAPAPQQDQPPVPQDDYVTTRPGREVTVPVLANDVDPEGGNLGLVSVEGGEALGAEVREDRVAVQVPAESDAYPATYTVRYTIKDAPRGLTATGSVIVEVTPDAPRQAPVARDDALTLADVVGREAVDVPVLKNDDDPDGSTADLTVRVSAETATVLADGQVRVTLLPTAQVLPYTIRDLDGQEATAFIRVPGVADLRPVLKPGSGDKVTGTDPLTITLADVVIVATDNPPRITRPDRVTDVGGTCVAEDEFTVVFTATAGYNGLAACSFEVTDGTGPDDPQGRTAVLTYPITVLPGADQPNQQPEFVAPSVTVPRGESATTDLVAIDPDPADQGNLRFAIVGDPPDGLAARIEGGARLVVEARMDLETGTTANLDVSVTDGVTEPVVRQVQVTVVGSSKPLATVIDDEIPRANQGQTYRVDVLANDVNPLPGTPLRVVSATTESGDGTAGVDGTSVVIAPGTDFVGTMVVRYRVGDATEDPLREVDGRVRLTVRGRPEAPLTPTVAEVRSHTVVLTWAPPVNNGDLIRTYTVTSPQGYTRDCPTTTCTLDGLTNNVEYTFTVTATNEVGTSDPSPASAPARPDQRPDPPQAPTLKFGDGSLTVTWVNQDYAGDRSPIQSVNLQISPAPASGQATVTTTGTQYVWSGLTNGTAYQVRIQAVNKAPEPSDWGAFSASEIPAGLPAVPAAPTTSTPAQVGSGPQAQMTVSWTAPNNNGDAISEYSLQVLRGGSPVNTLTVAGGATSQAVTVDTSETAYTFTVAARNKVGYSAASAPSAPRRGVIAPGAVTGLSAAPLDNAIQLTFGPAPGNGASASEIRYQYSLNGANGPWNNLAADKRIAGLSNGSSYTVWVKAVSNVDGQDYASLSPAAAPPVVPYGPPGTPGVGGSVSGGTITFSWAPPAPNGRDITAIQYRIDGTGDATVGPGAGSTSRSFGQSETHCVSARAQDATGTWGSWSGQWCGSIPRTSWTVVTNDATCPELLDGTFHFSSNGCTSPGGFIRVNTTLTVTCFRSDDRYPETTTRDTGWFRISGGTRNGWYVSRPTVNGDTSGMTNC